MDICSIILSAGKGSRMLSDIPKPQQSLSGKTLLEWVIDANKNAKIKKSIIVAPKQTEINKYALYDCELVIQSEPKGTADAVLKTKKLLKDFNGIIFICFADTPFISPNTIKKIIKSFKSNTKLVITGFEKKEVNEYGKIVFSEHKKPCEIIEKNSPNFKNFSSNFCNGGIMAIHSSAFLYLEEIQENKISNEYYLTDIVKILHKQNKDISFIKINEEEILGINTHLDLSIAEKISQNAYRRKAMLNGVKLIDPETVFFNFDTNVGKNVVIHPNVVFGKNVSIESHVEIKSFSHIEECIIKKGCVVGPFARIRGNSILGEKNKIGNFVEIKKSNLDNNVKINHLSYIGDTDIGAETNVGAGTITCNYDGRKKNKSKIGKNSFVGSNSTIIAPINIGKNVTLGAGSVFTNDIPDNTLSIARSRQINKTKK